MKRCSRCGVPLDGFLYNTIASKIFGIRPSDLDPDICNKCIDKPARKGHCYCMGPKNIEGSQKKILVISGSPRKDGNTRALIDEFIKGVRSNDADIEVVHAAFLHYKAHGCLSCRLCQKSDKFECNINDDATPVLKRMLEVDTIVFATPLYFFSASAQIKMVFDRMFSLYKWDNAAGTMVTPLEGKELVVIASAFGDMGLDALEAPFKLTAAYTHMPFDSLLVQNAGVSGEIRKKPIFLKRAYDLGVRITS